MIPRRASRLSLHGRPGIRVDAGNSSSADDRVCVNIASNTTSGSGTSPGIGIRKQGSVATTNDFGIVGLSPCPTAFGNAENHVAGLNSGSELGVSADGVTNKRVIAISGDNFVSCSTAP
jgi:large repetitive protein